MSTEYEEVAIRRRGLTARYLSKGQGDPVLYLHGAIASKGWSPFLDALAQEYTVYAPLQPGFDEVEGLESLDDVVDLALYYLDLVDELDLAPVRVVGHFLGGMVATEMAALCPPDIRALALSAPTGFWREDTPVPDVFIMDDADIRTNMWHDPESPSALTTLPVEESFEARELRLLERSIDLTAAGKFLWPIPDRGLGRRIHRVKAPVLLVWGEDDRIVPPVYAEEFTDRLEQVETVTLPRCGHLPMLEQPVPFAEAVADFFKRS